jgi:hypothetical protein
MFPLDDLLGGGGTNSNRAARRRRFPVEPRLKDSGEGRSDTDQLDAPKDGHEERKSEAGRIHQTVKQQDVHDDGAENGERDRHITIDQEQHAAEEFRRRGERADSFIALLNPCD